MRNIESQIIEKYREISIAFGNEDHEFPFEFFVPHNAGGLHIEYDKSKKMSLIGTERGRETYREETYDIDELMYWIFKGAAFSRGQKYELENRHPTADPRKIWFPKALEEIGKISQSWRNRMKHEQEEILFKYPFSDIS